MAGAGEMDFGLGSSLDDESGEEPGDEDEASDGEALELAAAEEVAAAIKSGDAASIRDSLKAFVALCYPE